MAGNPTITPDWAPAQSRFAVGGSDAAFFDLVLGHGADPGEFVVTAPAGARVVAWTLRHGEPVLRWDPDGLEAALLANGAWVATAAVDGWSVSVSPGAAPTDDALVTVRAPTSAGGPLRVRVTGMNGASLIMNAQSNITVQRIVADPSIVGTPGPVSTPVVERSTVTLAGDAQITVQQAPAVAAEFGALPVARGVWSHVGGTPALTLTPEGTAGARFVAPDIDVAAAETFEFKAYYDLNANAAFGSGEPDTIEHVTLIIEPVTAPTNTITTVVGTGTEGFGGDGGLATAAKLHPNGIAVGPDGSWYIADTRNHRVRQVDAGGRIITVAGTGTGGFDGDGRPATESQLMFPRDVSVLPDGGLLIADAGNDRVRRVSGGIMTTFAGPGDGRLLGDGGPATQARLFSPVAVAATSDGGCLIGESGDARVRRVSPDGAIHTVAGVGLVGTTGDDGPGDLQIGGDGGPAVDAVLGAPVALAVTPDGSFLIADDQAHGIWRVSKTGIITTVAGNRVRGTGGDGGPATAAQLDGPNAVAPTHGGGFLIAEHSHRVRLVSPAGVITTIAGNGTPGFSGDHGPAVAAQLDDPAGLAIHHNGDVLIADRLNHRVRAVDAGLAAG